MTQSAESRGQRAQGRAQRAEGRGQRANGKALAVLLAAVLCLPAVAAQAVEEKNETWIASYEIAINEAKDERKAALLRKELGDYYVSQGDYASAAKQYSPIISLNPSPFSASDRYQMAIHLSWADRLDDAALILRRLLAEDPTDTASRTQLAKVLSWSDNLEEAGAEADKVLKDDPANQEALLAKANVLRWEGKAKESLPYYKQALSQGEYFDARLGLAYASLETGDEALARENSSMLKPSYPRQEKEFQKLDDALCAAKSHRPGVQYGHYTDSDDNKVDRTSLYYGFKFARWDSEVRYSYASAEDPIRKTKTQDLWVKTSHKEQTLTTGAGLGVSKAEEGGNLLSGYIKFDLDLDKGTAGITAAREALTDTAQLIENEITRSVVALALTQRPAKELSFAESFAHAGYSDGNGADDLRLTAKYTLLTSPLKVDAGYRFRYWDFRRQSGGGYFDPQDFTVHQIFLSLCKEYEGFYFFAEPYAGFQSFTRYGEKSDGTISGFYASAGWTSKRCTAFELYGEGGNYAGATAAGFSYTLVGFKLNIFI